MNLMEALSLEAEPTESPTLCKLGHILTDDSVPAQEQEILRSAVLNAKDWPADKLAFSLKKTPHPVGASLIKLHRRRLCGCYV